MSMFPYELINEEECQKPLNYFFKMNEDEIDLNDRIKVAFKVNSFKRLYNSLLVFQFQDIRSNKIFERKIDFTFYIKDIIENHKE